jgi:hypothetical protein
MEDKLKAGTYKQTKPETGLKVCTTRTGSTSVPGTRTAPLKDISNVASCSKSSTLAKMKISKHHNTLANDRATNRMEQPSLPIKCVSTNVNSDLHHSTSMDAHCGHSPPDECAGAVVAAPLVAPLVAPPQVITSDIAVVAEDENANMVDALSSSDKEDMVDKLSSSDEEDMVTY